jgi:hypothetical protein
MELSANFFPKFTTFDYSFKVFLGTGLWHIMYLHTGQRGLLFATGTDVMIFYIFSPKNLAKNRSKNRAFWVQTTVNFLEICILTLVFKKTPFFVKYWQKYLKIVIITSNPVLRTSSEPLPLHPQDPLSLPLLSANPSRDFESSQLNHSCNATGLNFAYDPFHGRGVGSSIVD